MIAIEFKFPTGKLHATPWGRQVNEGAVEWPPSPWRILRALVAVWHNKFPDIEEVRIRELVEALSELPSFVLPPASQGHTRHYMPTAKNPAMVFDTFVVVPKHKSVIACWQHASPTDAQRELLSMLLDAMSYFGRAESWVEAGLVDHVGDNFDAVPVSEEGIISGWQLKRILVAQSESTFTNWRQQAIDERLATALGEKKRKAEVKGKSVEGMKLTAKETQKVEEHIPADLFDALHVDTTALRKAGWNRPPGSDFAEYVRREKAFDAVPASRRNVSSDTTPPTVARFAVTGTVVPRLTQALRIGERARSFIMGCSRRANAEHGNESNTSPVFSGKNSDGTQSSNSHRHAHFLCESVGNRGRITHLNVFARDGFKPIDEQALARFTRTWGDDGRDLQFVLLGIGQPEDFGGFNAKAGQSPGLATAQTWISRTPFVPSRHFKLKSAERNVPTAHEAAIERELRTNILLELSRRPEFAAYAETISIEPQHNETASTRLGSKHVRWLEFVRERKSGRGHKGSSHGYGAVLRFPEPVTGPIALGYGCHFGLGQFIPCDSRDLQT